MNTEQKQKPDLIEQILNRITQHLMEVDEIEAKSTSPHILTWQTEDRPYDALHYILNVIAMFNKKVMVKEFNFYCTALGGDSVGWQITFHLKELEPKP